MNAGAYPSYYRNFNASYGHLRSYGERRTAYLSDRFGGAHLLQPVLDQEEWASFTIGTDPILQAMWARENDRKQARNADEILLQQIENHRTEVFYNLDPITFGSSFIRKLPGCVKYKLCWRAAPSPGADFSAYDRVMCNFPSILRKWEAHEWKTASFYPAHDPEMDAYAVNQDRQVDVCFVGGFSRHHHRRTAILDAVAGLQDRFDIRYFLDVSRFTKIAEFLPTAFSPLAPYCRSTTIKSACREPVFGRDYYQLLGNAKIVLNGAIGMARKDRGNMRCFEAMGCGGLLLSDEGSYPTGMEHQRTMLTYSSPADAADIVAETLADWAQKRNIAANGHQMIRENYSKEKQWQAFLQVIEEI